MTILRIIRLLLLGIFLAGSFQTLTAVEFYLSPQGNDDGTGSEAQPFLTLERAKNALQEEPIGKEPATIWIHGGRYQIEKTLVLGPEMAGTKACPIRFRAVEGEVPIFDAGLELPLTQAELVSQEEESSRFSELAAGKVYSLSIRDRSHRDLLSKASTKLSMNGRMMSLSRFPNRGFAHISKIHDKGAIYTLGRTTGKPPAWSIAKPIGGRFSVLNKDVSNWAEESLLSKKAQVTGYFAYDWYREKHAIASIENGEVQLGPYSRYGLLSREKIPRRFYASNLLCELDAPGEFYFDEKQSLLFFIPPAAFEDDSYLSIWGGSSLVQFKGASFVSLEGVVIEGVGKGTASIEIVSGHNLRVMGCTVRNSTRTGIVISGGTNCGISSCDIYDVASHLILDGGEVATLTPANNFAENCHFTQVAPSDFYGGIRIRGVGHRFEGNLVHNCPGQVMTFGGCDHLITHNEFFNIGFEEGDGGVIYSGASAWSWGNKIENNFIHHIMCLPEAHPRGGIYPDDGDMGESIVGNIFYKAAHRAVLLNGGAGHHVHDNIFLKGHIGIYNTENYGDSRYRDLARYQSGELKRGDKGDWVWRTEQVIGKEGWNRPPWSARFPKFREIMNQERERNFPISCQFIDNRFYGNHRDIEWRTGKGEEGVTPIEKVKMVEASGNRAIAMNLFRDEGALDFRYRTGVSPAVVPKIDFARIGLLPDSYRKEVPPKESYRTAIRNHFEKRKSYDATAKYQPETMTEEIYFNSGKLLFEIGAMIHDK